MGLGLAPGLGFCSCPSLRMWLRPWTLSALVTVSDLDPGLGSTSVAAHILRLPTKTPWTDSTVPRRWNRFPPCRRICHAVRLKDVTRTSPKPSTTTAATRCASSTPRPPPSLPPGWLSDSASSAAGCGFFRNTITNLPLGVVVWTNHWLRGDPKGISVRFRKFPSSSSIFVLFALLLMVVQLLKPLTVLFHIIIYYLS